MKLSELKLLFMDCQTTGMRPSVGSLLEMAWGWGKAQDQKLESLQSELVLLPEGEDIPPAVRVLTGIQSWDLVQGIKAEELFKRFQESYENHNQHSVAVIHYAQFEKPFLQDLFSQFSANSELPFEVLCSQKIAKRLFPQLPSRNIRGLAGYFGNLLGELKRASSHVQATYQIWVGIVEELEKQNVLTLEDLHLWLKNKKTEPVTRYEYRIPKEKRLTLPEKPGIYRMKAKSGDILYVGKATSLRNRVNSYFRGKKGRDPKKLEMLTQVWDLDFIQTETVLEALLLESDEIKRLDPPYNISLKTKERSLRFFSRDFEIASNLQNDLHPIGPFRPQGPIDQLKIVQTSLKNGALFSPFYEPIEKNLVDEGFQIFCQQYDLQPETFYSMRSMLALGLGFYREKLKLEKELSDDLSDEETENPEEEVELTALDVAGKFQRLFCRAGESLRRSRRLTRLLNAHVEWESEVGWKILEFRNGKLQATQPEQPRYPWENLGISDYDRMCILLNEISRCPHRIWSLSSATASS